MKQLGCAFLRSPKDRFANQRVEREPHPSLAEGLLLNSVRSKTDRGPSVLTLKIDNPNDFALFLDLDGTVLDIAAQPTDTMIPVGLTTTLSRLHAALDGALAVLTGRTIVEVDRLLSPLRLAAAGVHGSELRLEPEGEVESVDGEVPAPLLAAVEDLARAFPGVLIEHKRISVAVHYRNLSEQKPALEALLRRALDEHANQLVLSHGRRVLELVPARHNKASAMARLMQSPNFRGRRPIMIGDDLPDEAALAAATRLGGRGLTVRGEHFKAGNTDFADPGQVRNWLNKLADALKT